MATGPSVIPLSIQIKGGFFQVLDYLNRLEDMGRLVIVDAHQRSPRTVEHRTDPSGPPVLVGHAHRAHVHACRAAGAGRDRADAGIDVGHESASTPPASGSSSGETSTTAQVN